MSDPRDWKILLIDDEDDIREVVTLALADAGFNVVSAGDGESGVRMCEAVSPQIVITDIRMPKMDGIQVLESIKKRHPDIEVIVVTAFGEMDLAIRALQLDASDFITKPIDDASLHLALGRAQERYTARRALKDYTALLEKEKARTSRELVRTFNFQKNLIESSMDGIMGCDDNGIVVIFNRSMERMLGWSKAEAVAVLTLEQIFGPGEDIRFKENLAGEGLGGSHRLSLFETALVGKNGKSIPVQVAASRLMAEGTTSGLVCFFRDLREIRALEREVADQACILHQDKMMSLGKLAASVVHEINNPLSGILNYIRLMARIIRRGPLPDDRREKFIQYLDLVETETDRCSHIVSSLLAFSRKSPPAFGRVQLNELLDRCLSLSRHKMQLQNIELVTRIASELPAVTGDFNQLQQCVINLVFNAVDAMPHGGTLTLSGEYEPSNQQVSVSIRDTGHGILADDLPHIFEPFFTTKKEGYGVGLGLSTIFGILERHDGSVDVASRPGQGAVFRLMLPVK